MSVCLLRLFYNASSDRVIFSWTYTFAFIAVLSGVWLSGVSILAGTARIFHGVEAFSTVYEYIASYSGDVRKRMETLRQIILECSPDITEKISWGMATFVLNGNLVHFSGEKRHLGFHPSPSAIEAFKDGFADYKYSKGTLQLAYDKPMPYELLRQMILFRVQEQTKK